MILFCIVSFSKHFLTLASSLSDDLLTYTDNRFLCMKNSGRGFLVADTHVHVRYADLKKGAFLEMACDILFILSNVSYNLLVIPNIYSCKPIHTHIYVSACMYILV